MGNEHPLVDALDACKYRFTSMEQTLHIMMANNLLLAYMLFKRVSTLVSNWFKMQLQRLTLHPVPVLIKLFDTIDSEGP